MLNVLPIAGTRSSATEIDALVNMPILRVGSTEIQKNAFAEVIKTTLRGAA